MKSPFFFGFAALMCFYLVFANWRGWSVFNTGSANRWGPQGRTVYHK